jgi:hypothetical protein
MAVELAADAHQKAAAKKAMKKKPSPAMKRNSQNITGTLGTVSHAALRICASLAWRGSARCRLSSRA